MFNTDVPMRQLDWWEVLQVGDRIVFTDEVGTHRYSVVVACDGETVDEMFFQYKKDTGRTAMFYRPMEKTK